MTIRSVLPLVATLLVFGSATASAQRDASSLAPPPAFPDPDRVAKLSQAFPAIDRVMRDFAERSRVPGIAYGIVIDGRLAHRGTVGFRELRSRTPVDSSSVFRIASMSKSFAALAILQLRDEGKLALDDAAERYV
ncbi:MAG: serine hydrolase domain-containing protein, partial [Gemmatimonadales bacterium]